MKRFDQVRLVSDRTKFGQVAWVTRPDEETTATGPLWEVHVQWGGEGGNVQGHYLSDLRRETFLEFILKRPGYVGKTPLPFVIYCLLVWLGLTLSVPAIGAVFIALFFGFQYANFKGWTR